MDSNSYYYQGHQNTHHQNHGGQNNNQDYNSGGELGNSCLGGRGPGGSVLGGSGYGGSGLGGTGLSGSGLGGSGLGGGGLSSNLSDYHSHFDYESLLSVHNGGNLSSNLQHTQHGYNQQSQNQNEYQSQLQLQRERDQREQRELQELQGLQQQREQLQLREHQLQQQREHQKQLQQRDHEQLQQQREMHQREHMEREQKLKEYQQQHHTSQNIQQHDQQQQLQEMQDLQDVHQQRDKLQDFKQDYQQDYHHHHQQREMQQNLQQNSQRECDSRDFGGVDIAGVADLAGIADIAGISGLNAADVARAVGGAGLGGMGSLGSMSGMVGGAGAVSGGGRGSSQRTSFEMNNLLGNEGMGGTVNSGMSGTGGGMDSLNASMHDASVGSVLGGQTLHQENGGNNDYQDQVGLNGSNDAHEGQNFQQEEGHSGVHQGNKGHEGHEVQDLNVNHNEGHQGQNQGQSGTNSPEDNDGKVNPEALKSLSHHELAQFASNLIPTFSHQELIGVVQYMLLAKDGLANDPRTNNPDKTLSNPNSKPQSNIDQTTTNNNSNNPSPTDDNSEATWENYFKKLTEYKTEHGDCNCNSGPLRKWITKQRRHYLDNTLTKERLDRLTQIGFWTNVRPKRKPETQGMKPAEVWDHRFKQMLEYKEEHGTSNVPRDYQEKPGLGDWCAKQRKFYRKGKLSEEKTKKLQDVGFDFKKMGGGGEETHGMSLEQIWEFRYNQLVEYRYEHGNCNVPQKSATNMVLARWVCTQRKARRKGRLPNDRIERLNQLGFEWNRMGQSNVR